MNIGLVIQESIALTLSFLKANKLRSLLSVIGITIGIFCIVFISTATHSLEQNLRQNVDKMGDNIIYVQKWPWGFGGNYQWWDYLNRPESTLKEYKRLKKEGSKDVIRSMAYTFDFGGNKITSSLEEVTDVSAKGVMGDFFEINKWDMATGRTFNDFEIETGKNTCIVGYNLAMNLFAGENPVGRDVRFNGYKATIVGVIEEQGTSLGGPQYDDIILLPSIFAGKFAKAGTRGVSSAIVVKGYDKVDLKPLTYEIKRIMRSMRKLRPKDKDNFAINKLTMFSDGLDQTFGMLDIPTIIIGGFSLLVGGFGIANIMFVSVKERTGIIGLQKALGARRIFIMSQFLFESMLLCLIGAFMGILLVIGIGLFITYMWEFKIFFSLPIFLVWSLVSVLIGLVAGIAPALSASGMDPVEALRK